MGIKWGWLALILSDRVIRPTYKAQERKVWSPDDARRFLESAGRWCALWVVALASACRPGELRGLTWGDVDFEGGTIAIRRSMAVVGNREITSEGKTNLSRRVATLEPEVIAALREWRKQQAEELLRLGVRNPEGCVWTWEDGTRVLEHAVTDAFKRDAKRAGLHGTPYLMRHWHASMLLGNSEPVPNVSARLGHANPYITMMTYAHMVPGDRGTPSVMRRVLARRDPWEMAE